MRHRQHSRILRNSKLRDVIVVINEAALGCGSSLKEYGNWLHDERGKKFGATVKDITEFLVASGFPAAIKSSAFDETCHLP